MPHRPARLGITWGATRATPTPDPAPEPAPAPVPAQPDVDSGTPDGIPLLPGWEAADSPDVDSPSIDGRRWNAWIDLVDYRRLSRPAPRVVLEAALGGRLPGGPVERAWPLWWDRAHPGGVLTHRATVAGVVDGARMLLTRCGYSRAHSPSREVWQPGGVGGGVPGPAERTYCSACLTP